MISTSSPIVIFGAGSIGERHIGILQELGYQNLAVYRQRNLPFRNSEISVKTFRSLSEVIDFQPEAAIICTPTSQHFEQTLFCLKEGIPVLVEKPLSHELAGMSLLKKAVERSNVLLQVAYMLRYHPFFLQINKDIEKKKYGQLISMQSYWGEYLPDWHPWEDYRESYAAKKDLGGGAALTLSHDIDILNWLADSQVSEWKTIKNHSSTLEIDVESAADISLIYQNGVTAHCHLNFHEKVPNRWYRFVFEKASVQMNYLDNEITVYSADQQPAKTFFPDFQRNDMFKDQMKDFLQKIETDSGNGLTYINESEKILQICLS